MAHQASMMGQEEGLTLRLARTEADLGNLRSAIQRLAMVINSEPKSTTGPYVASLYCSTLGRYEEASRYASDLIRKFPRNAEGYLAMAGLLHRRGLDDQAAALFRDAEKQNPSLEDRVRLAAQQARLGDPEAGIQALTRLTRESPWHQPGWALLGAMYLGRSQPKDARRCLEEAVRLNERDARSHVLLAKAILAGNNPTSQHRRTAQRRIDRSLQINPDDPEALIARGDLQRSLRHWAEAANDYAGALRLDPDRAQLRYSYALACARSGWKETAADQRKVYSRLYRKDRERRERENAIDARHPRPSDLLALARYLMREGECATALETAQRASVLAPTDRTIAGEVQRIEKDLGW